MTSASERWLTVVDELGRRVLELARCTEASDARRAEVYREVMFSLLASLPPAGSPGEVSRTLLAASESVSARARNVARGTDAEVVALETSDIPSNSDPEAELIQREQARRLLEKIPVPARDFLELWLEGCSLDDIHERTGFSVATVRWRLERALWTVRQRTQTSTTAPLDRQY